MLHLGSVSDTKQLDMSLNTSAHTYSTVKLNLERHPHAPEGQLNWTFDLDKKD